MERARQPSEDVDEHVAEGPCGHRGAHEDSQGRRPQGIKRHFISPASAAQRRRNLIVIHGGEPLTLPTRYLEEVLKCFDEVVREEADEYQLSVQTNLLSVPEEKLELLLARNAALSVSYDWQPGVRLNVAGRPTEAAVSANIDRLRARGLRLGGIAVLAKHTVDHVTSVYDFYAERGMTLRILPLFDGPAERPQEQLKIGHAEIVGGLERLFRHWMSTGCQVGLHPFVSHFETTLRHMTGARVPTWSREFGGDSVLLVNVDGRVYRVLDAYEEALALGDLKAQTIPDVLGSPSYAASLARDRQAFDKQCRSCRYLGACSGAFIHESRTADYTGNCPVAYPTIGFMQNTSKNKALGRRSWSSCWTKWPPLHR